MDAMVAYALTIFTGAFLLFQVQPLIGKYILPWFGGGPGVWTACMLFFQVALLGGYAYAHYTSRLLKPRAQAATHLLLLAAALVLLPITPADSWKPRSDDNPTLRILGLLTACLGLPYFALSTTGPLMQQWFSRTNAGASPYRMYALSNAGSLIALISYPFIIEPHFTRKMQAELWAYGLGLYVFICGFCAVRFWKSWPANPSPSTTADSAGTDPALSTPSGGPSTLVKVLWLLLPACASVLLLATTNKLCQDVAVVPFLWVLPLALYLLSFIICFDHARWYARPRILFAFIAALGGICWMLFAEDHASIRRQVGIYSAGLFICCMVCHGELYRLRPDPRHLTVFYLRIAAGGALGGVFVALVAPLIFTNYYELHGGLLLCGLLFLVACARDRDSTESGQWCRRACFWLSAAWVGLAAALGVQAWKSGQQAVFRSRNFYGTLAVCEYHAGNPASHYFLLRHGSITHGLQFVDPNQARKPTAYYGEASGVGRAMDVLPDSERRIGMVGLGAGAIAAYGRAGDYLRIYEINSAVTEIATTRFTYLSQCPAKIEIVTGDARLSLERESPRNFDLLALDAFSGDAVPVHLLTKEAFEVYGRHVKTNGIIAVHISNEYLNLKPVLAKVARQLNYRMAVITRNDPYSKRDAVAGRPRWEYDSTWVLLSRSEKVLNSPVIRYAASTAKINGDNLSLWTDDFASLFQILE